MRKIMLGVLAGLLLIGCGKTETQFYLPEGDSITQQVTSLSDSGLKEYYNWKLEIFYRVSDKNHDNSLKFEESLLPLKHFNKIDRNKDNGLSLEEYKQGAEFVIGKINNYRLLAQNSFKNTDIDKNKIVDRNEFIKKVIGYSIGDPIGNYPYYQHLMDLYSNKDINKDSFLNFSEFEDFYYILSRENEPVSSKGKNFK